MYPRDTPTGGMILLGNKDKEGDMLLEDLFHHQSESDLGILWQSGVGTGLVFMPSSLCHLLFPFAYGVICIILSSHLTFVSVLRCPGSDVAICDVERRKIV